MYTLLYSKWITNKNQLHSTWNFPQCHMPAWMGGGLGENACVLSHSVVSNSETPWAIAYQAPVHGDNPGKNTRVGEWVAISFARISSRSRDGTHVSYVSYTGRRVLYHGRPLRGYMYMYN